MFKKLRKLINKIGDIFLYVMGVIMFVVCVEMVFAFFYVSYTSCRNEGLGFIRCVIGLFI